jgi:ABC-type sugar transport system substrate-binding protein
MKHTRVVVSMFFVVSILLSACSSSTATQGPSNAPPGTAQPGTAQPGTGSCKIGVVVLVLTGSPFQIALADSAKKVGESLGCSVSVQAPQDFTAYDQQVSIVENLISQKVDFIFLDAADPKALVPAVEKAAAAGVPVVNVDNMVDSNKVLTYVGTDNEKAAEQAAQWLVTKLNGKGNIALLTGEAGTPNEVLRTTGYKKILAQNPGIKIVAELNSHWSSDGGLTAMENVLQANPQGVDAVIAENDDAAAGAAQALKNANLAKKPILIGFDGTPGGIAAVKDGSLDATVGQYPNRMAQIAIRLGLAYNTALKPLQGMVPQSLFSMNIDTGATVVTKANVDQYVADSSK